MIKHIVMWKLDASYSESEKAGLLEEFRNKLINLEGKINVLKGMSVHLNSQLADDTNFDILLDTSFETIDGLKTYANHPEHLKVVEFAGTFKKVRSCVDYEI